VRKGSESKFKDILEKWHCEAETIGETTGDGFLKMSFQAQQVVNLPVERLMDPPLADLPAPKEQKPVEQTMTVETVSDVREEWRALQRLLSEPRIASKQAVYERYDSTVGASTLFGPGQEAAVLWLGSHEHPHLGLGIKGAWDESYARVNPRLAAHHAAAECARALACVGAEALALTDGINLGNPKKAEVQWSLIESVEGLNEAMRVFGTPCIGGNVSLYNQTIFRLESGREEAKDIDPTIFVVMVGKINDVQKTVGSQFKKAGNEVWLIEAPGNPQALPHGSTYARLFWPEEAGQLPWIDLQAERQLQKALLGAHERRLFQSLRDVSDGGLAVALAEACFASNIFGFEADLSKWTGRRDFLLFHEGGGRVVVEVEASRRAELMKWAMEFKLDCKRLGQVLSEPVFRIRPLCTGPIAELYSAWRGVFG
jgi:phosphoribosylformylglycinamidine synthase